MNSSDAEAVAATATALAPQVEIGRSASFPILQVMSPTVGTYVASSETMADMLANENVQRREGRNSRSPRRSPDSTIQVRATSTVISLRPRSPEGQLSGVQQRGGLAKSVPTRRT